MKKILVVDDDPSITFTFKTILEKEGFQVAAFNDSSQAASKFRAGLYDVALIDIRMPKMNGFELYREIRKKDNQIRICFITAYEISKDESGNPSADSSVVFMKKPIGREDLIDQIQTLVSA